MGTITTFLYQYGLLAMVVLILLEYACFPVSSEIVLPMSGAIASISRIPYFQLLICSILAGLAGTSLCYAIGRLGGSFLLNRFMDRFPKSRKPIESSYGKFNRYGSLAVCISRLIPLCRTYIAFVAGAIKLDYLSYLIASFFGVTIWNALLIGFGYILGSNWKNTVDYYNRYKELFLFPILFFFLFFILRRLKKSLDTKRL